MKTILTSLLLAGMAFAVSDQIISGVVEVPSQHIATEIELPADFDFDAAQLELKQARAQGNAQRARELSQMIHQYWLEHREMLPDPVMRGEGSDYTPERMNEERKANTTAPLWGDDVRIDPNEGVQQVAIASASNGDLYSSSVWNDGGDWHYLLHLSENDGATWTLLWETSQAGFDFMQPGIFVSLDTVIISYILYRQSDGYYRTWTIAAGPGPTWNPIYYGSPTGNFQDIEFSDFRVCTDGAIYSDHYVYATWTENYMPDSTRPMTAVSQDIDVSAWEGGPTVLDVSGGGAYWSGTRIAYGSNSDACWIVGDAHPGGYPGTFDEAITGWLSTNWGATWSPYQNITPFDNRMDEYEAAVAGAHDNANWVVLHTTADTSTHADPDIDNTYSLDDGTNWTTTGWIGAHENYLADVWVDNASTGFYGACRQDRTGGVEHIRYKDCPIGDPTAWTVSVEINDNLTGVLSDFYGPSVTYNDGNAEACIAWTGFAMDYSIWFDSYSATAVEERNDVAQAVNMRLAPNPSQNSARLSYTVATDGAVLITLYDATGRMVTNLVNTNQPAGDYAFVLDNTALSAGVYFVQIETPTTQGNIPMTIVR